MTSTIDRARHRAPVARTTTLNALSRAVSSNAGTVGRQAAVVVAASGLVLAAGLPAQASVSTDRQALAATPLSIVAGSVTAPANAPFELPLVAPSSTSGAEFRAQVAAEKAAAQAAEEQAAAAAAQAAADQVAADQAAAAQTAAAGPAASGPAAQAASGYSTPVQATGDQSQASATKKAPAAPTGTASTIAAAAYAQLGVNQDCTMLVTNALAAAGINHHGWPASYLSLGRTVSAAEAMPGDLIYYADGGMGMAHIAVYVGGGQAVHGGFNGGSTVVAPAELGSGGVYIRVGG
ncbi:hypothetical protein GD627_11365 [Arthrobacter yangruifuii]|uniref:NlpC/P60 domain-containing protein n=1 Tax=Arthrobacter yangruifuii TaxID=2606616 RepID=A0A5N6MES0_9MICC|nr:NlpC/P60 family protein [Arthrobacter yangruifuii]KAD3514911.1 hypothetical protein GD627_11365 [Arthrobacter yangruifuii]